MIFDLDIEVKNGYSADGAVIGATYPEEMTKYRELLPHSIFLVPGIGAQGGDINEVHRAFNQDGLGALINVGRAIIYSFDNTDPIEKMQKSISNSAKNYNDSINRVLKANNKYMF